MIEQQLSPYPAVDSSVEPADRWRHEVHDRLTHYKRRRGGRRIEGAYSMRFPFPAYEPEPGSAVESPERTPAPFAAEPLVAQLAPEIEPLPALAAETPHPPAELALILEPAIAAEAVSDELAAAEFSPTEIDFPAPPLNLVLQPPPAIEDDTTPFVDPIVRPRPKRKVIAFPRHLSVAPEPTQRLADPVSPEVPRILDVPEELEAIPSTPYLDGLQLDAPDPAAEAARRDHIELPFQPVAVSKRLLAAALDLVVISLSTALFGAVAYKILDSPAPSKFLILGLLAAAVTLWFAYQYLFLVHAGKTLGMMAARIRLRTFNGKAPSLRLRRHRALALCMSSMALGMGLMWSLVDVDGLCWHDRLSTTFLASRE